MREIKFRGYDTELEEMTYFESDDYILQYGDILREYIDDYDNFGNPEFAYESVKDKVELMQYTGLHDKNGKEIYEGDIVKVPVKRHSSSNWWQDTNINHGETGDFVYKQVKYFEYTNSFRYNLSGFDLADLPITKKQKEEIAKPRGKERTKQCVDDLNYTFIELEVIGNIYDNPELLERSSNGD